jgi:hypothetical protein
MAAHRPGPPQPAPPSSDPARAVFRGARADWLAHRPPAEPLYCLAEPIISGLERHRLRRPPLLDPRAAAAERHLNRLCRQYNAIGWLDGSPIANSLLSPPVPLHSEAEMIATGLTPEVRREIVRSAQLAADNSLRLKGYAGWLLTEPAFLAQSRGLADRWAALPPRDRPRFPLRRGSFHADLPEAHRVSTSEVGAAFGADFFRFCDHWGLAGMASWDLPDPQGALFPTLLPPGAPALPRQGLHLYLPIHYPMTGDDELLARILQEQRALARDAGLPRSAAGLPHHRAYATLLEVLHWERAAAARFGAARVPRGFVDRIKEAIAATLGLSVDRIDKCRRAISACRRGRRDSVAALRITL